MLIMKVGVAMVCIHGRKVGVRCTYEWFFCMLAALDRVGWSSRYGMAPGAGLARDMIGLVEGMGWDRKGRKGRC